MLPPRLSTGNNRAMTGGPSAGAGSTFAPMPRRDPGALTRIASRFSQSASTVEAMRLPHAQFWDEWNARAHIADGPLWVALGDSTSQGIGAPDPEDSWVPLMLERIRNATGEPWRVINLSMTGAQLVDVLHHQLPRIDDLRAEGHSIGLVSHLAGANDMISLPNWPRSTGRLRRVLGALPADSVVARVGEPFPKGGFMARRLNSLIEAEATRRPFHLFWPWQWPSRDGLAADKWHPGPKGYGYMVDLIWDPVRASLRIG